MYPFNEDSLIFLANACKEGWQTGQKSVQKIVGSVAERSKALVLGTSLFGGVGSNPTAAMNIFYMILYYQKIYNISLDLFCSWPLYNILRLCHSLGLLC
jgi:predicted ATPase